MSGPRFSIVPGDIIFDDTLEARDLQVLLLLGRHIDDSGWCRRSQVKMAKQLRCGRATVQRSLQRLVEAGWVEVRSVSEPGEQPRHSHFYRVKFEDRPVIVGESEVPESEAGGAHERAPPLPTGGQGCPPIRGHITTPLNEEDERDARAREDENHIPDRPWLDEMIRLHPQGSHARMVDLARPWRRFDRDKRKRARDNLAVWLGEKGGRKVVAGLDTYLEDEMFDRVKSPAASPSGEQRLSAPAFDQMWFACWLDFVDFAGDRLLDGYSAEAGLLRRHVSAAKKFAGPWKIPNEVAWERVQALSAKLIKIHKQSPECEAWAEHFRRLGADLPIPDKVAWIFMPAAWPPPDKASTDPPGSLEELDQVIG